LLQRIYLIWAEFETFRNPIKDKTQMNTIMNICVEKYNSIDAWERYINYEKYFGDINSVRNIFKRAIESKPKAKDKFVDKYIQWENM
jgi:hypothetical protein